MVVDQVPGEASDARDDKTSLPSGYLASASDFMQLQLDDDPLLLSDLSLCSICSFTCTQTAS